MQMNKIFDIRTLPLCLPLETDIHTAFFSYELSEGEEYGTDNLPLNFILFVLDGEISVCCNEFSGHRFRSGEMTLMQRSSAVRMRILRDTRLVMFYFDTFISVCEHHLFRALQPEIAKATYRFSPVPMPEPIKAFLEQLLYFQSLNLVCAHFNALKHRELFILLRHFCSRDELVALMAPLTYESQSFRTKVLDKYPQLTTGRVSELASLVGMGRKNFDKRFNEEFGTSPARWIQQEIAKKVKIFLSTSDVTIADAIEKFHFSSPAHFNRFCRRYFGKTPGELMREAKELPFTSV